MYVRAADRYDCHSLAQLRAAGLIELTLLAADETHEFVARATRDFDALFRAERLVAWVACDAERVVASSCAVFFDRLPYREGSRHAEICGVYVEPAYRNSGLASELVAQVVGAARADDARRIYLRPAPSATQLYVRLGFVETHFMVLGDDAATAPVEPSRSRGDGSAERVSSPV